MTEPVVGFMVQRLLASLNDEASFILGFRSELEKMRTHLTPMKSFLIDLHQLKNRDNNNYEIVKSSMATLRELIYDADDILLDCQLRADYRREVSMMPSIFSPCELLFRYQTGRRLKEINNRINEEESMLKTYCPPFLSHQISQEESYNTKTRWTTPILIQSEIVGLTENTRLIKEWILPQNMELQQVGIVGMGGLGKTTLAKNIFNDKDVGYRFHERIWVSVSQPVNMVNIMKSMLQQLRLNDEGIESTLLQKIHEGLVNKKYLIVMDDVWSTDENGWWGKLSDALKQEGIYSNSSIIITTRDEVVARNMGARDGRIHKPKVLDEKDSWSLFCNVACSATKGKCRNHDLENVGLKIVKKCDGLPLAIKTIGGLLSTKPQSITEWEKVHDDFGDKLAENVNDDSVISILQLSYDALPARLKHCILCFSIYPEDFLIETEQLVHWWVGEGFVQANDRKTTAKELAFDCLSELLSRCLVEVVEPRGYDGRVDHCKLHDMVRELVIRRAKEEAFSSFDDGNAQKFDPDSRHLGLLNDEMGRQSVRVANSKLRALLMVSKDPYFFTPYTSDLSKVHSLRMLDLGDRTLEKSAFFNYDPDSTEDLLLGWIRSQKRLAYLKLGRLFLLKELPNWMRELRNLQYLILHNCPLLEKLSHITSLRKLIVLDVRSCPNLKYFPQGLEKLPNLEELYGFKLASSSSSTDHGTCRFGDLKSLPKLRVLQLEIGDQQDIIVAEEDRLEVLSQFHHLQILEIDSKGAHEVTLVHLDELSPPKSLQKFTLKSYHRDVLPKWVNCSSLPELRYLCIESSFTNISPNFWGSQEEKKYWKIEGLRLKKLPCFEAEWKILEKMMPSIRYVEVVGCPLLQSFPYNEIINQSINFNENTIMIWRKREEEEEE